LAALADIVNAERRKALILAARAKGVKPKTSEFLIWREIARPKQLRPEGKRCFILRGGRGSGKTRAGAEDLLEQVRRTGQDAHVVAPTAAALRVCFDGISGIVKCARPGEIVRSVMSPVPTIYFANGAQARGYSGEAPNTLNGPQTSHLWVDEYGLTPKEAIDMARLGCRLGDATSCFTSTPKPTMVTRYIQKIYPDAHLVVMPMSENADNLHPDFVKEQFLAYGGTRFAKSELEGELLDEIVGALWREEWFNREGFRVKSRIRQRPDGLLVFDRPRDMVMISIGVDPTVSMNRKHKLDVESGLLAADECGIVATGLYDDGTGEVIADVSGVYDATEWPRKVAKLYALLNAEVICAEKNQGGSLIKLAIAGHAPTANIKEVWATADKLSRATPLANLYEQGRFRHGPGTEQLEKEMVDWDASDKSALSPGRIDAAVWASHGLGLLRATGMKTTGGIVVNEVYGQRR